MRTLNPCAAVILLLAMFSVPSKADEVSKFAGTITQAPLKNIFGVEVGGFVSGDINYPVILGSNFNGSVNNFTIVFDVGPAVYTEVVSPTGNRGSVTLTNGLITDIEVTYPPTPWLAGVPGCPSLVLTGATFFTSPTDCQVGQVCGTLDFTNSQPQVAAEPSSILLLVSGLAALTYWHRKVNRRVRPRLGLQPIELRR